jgi:hypothetical protein
MTRNAEDYAESLCAYAFDRLDGETLHAWIACRLMTDGAADHDDAERLATRAIVRHRTPARAPASRGRPRWSRF